MATHIKTMSAERKVVERQEDVSGKRGVKRGLAADDGSLTCSVTKKNHIETSSKTALSDGKPIAVAQVGQVFSLDMLENFKKDPKNPAAIVRGIVHVLRHTSELMLAWKNSHLKEEGAKIQGLHPLCFIWSILSDKTAKGDLIAIKNATLPLKWNGFLGTSTFHKEGLVVELGKVYGLRKFEDIQGEFIAFYKALNLKGEALDPYVKEHKWEEFMIALLDEKSYLSSAGKK